MWIQSLKMIVSNINVKLLVKEIDLEHEQTHEHIFHRNINDKTGVIDYFGPIYT